MKCIPIESCAKCPHRAHQGAFATVAYVPQCRLANRELPYEPKTQGRLGRVIAVSTSVIPDWCPLPNSEDVL